MRKKLTIMLALMLALTYMPSAAFADDSLSGDKVQTQMEQYANNEDQLSSDTGAEDLTQVIANEVYIPAIDGQTLEMSKYTNTNQKTYIAEMQIPKNGYQEKKSTYYFKIPKKGAVVFDLKKGTNIADNYVNITGVNVDLGYIRTDDLESGARRYIYTSSKAGTMRVEMTQSMYTAGNGYTVFSALYYPDETKTINASSSTRGYTHGSYGVQTKNTKFKVKVPSKGYLVLDMKDASGESSPVYVKTTGFKKYETIKNSDSVRYIGVKKGTYTFNVKTTSPYYDVNVKFVKVKEGAFGTEKGKSKKIGKNASRKGLIITNAKVSKKTHWYKFTIIKNSDVNLQINSLLNGGGVYGGLQVSVYGKSGKIKSFNVLPDTPSMSVALSSKNLYGKLKKGTYYIKVQSKNTGNGYFALKWN